MKRKNHTPDQIVKKLLQADVRLAESLKIDQVCKESGLSDATYYKWRKEYGIYRELSEIAVGVGESCRES